MFESLYKPLEAYTGFNYVAALELRSLFLFGISFLIEMYTVPILYHGICIADTCLLAI